MTEQLKMFAAAMPTQD